MGGDEGGAGAEGFNEAEAIKPRNPFEVLVIAQVGPASMRPRQSSLGISPRPALRERRGCASMRPRQSSLGISVILLTTSLSAGLQ